jgi:PKD repeat protein
MKNFTLAVLLTVFCTSVFGQIQVNENQIIQVGESVIRHIDSLPGVTGFADKGADLYWDFTGATQHVTNTTNAINPTSTPYASSFPTSNLCMTNDNVNYLFFETSASENSSLGLSGDLLGTGDILVVEQVPPSLIYDYPLKYQKNYSDAYKVSEKADGSSINALVDSVWLKRESTHTDTIEAYGKVETDFGIYNAIKNKRIEVSVDTILTKSIFGGGWTQFDIFYTTTTTYYWHTREGKLPVAEYLVQDNGGDLTITEATPEPIANFGFEDACVGTVVQFTDSSIQNPTSWQWSFGDGSTSIDQNPTHTYNSSGTFTVQLIVDRNYPDTLEKTITINAATADAGNDQDICPGETATLSASGGSSYEWSTSETTANISVSPASNTNYTVTVTDANGCTDSDQVLVTVNPEPSPALFDAVSCNGNNVTLDAQNPGASYQWSNNATTQTISVGVGTYYVTITNASNCSIIDTAVVSAGANLTVPLVDVDACAGDTVTLSAGNTGASYLWSTGATTQTISVISAGTFTCTVTDQGCNGSGSSTVSFNPNPTPEVLGDTVICDGQSTYLFVNTNDQITWSDLSNNDSLMVSPSSSQYYYVDLENNFSCTARDSVFVTVNPLPTTSILSSRNEICLGEQATLVANGGIEYDWGSNDTNSTLQVQPTVNSTYTVTVTDANGCQNTAQKSIIVKPLPTVTISGNTEICEGDQTTLTASGGVSYAWSSGDSTVSTTVSPANATGYVVTVTGNNGCTETAQTTVDVNTLPNVQFAFDDTLICLNSNIDTLYLAASPVGGIYSGNGVENNYVLLQSFNATTTVYYTFTNNNNCSATDTLNVAYDVCSGIESALGLDFQVYPNPSANGFYVQSNVFSSEEVILNLIDLNGKVHNTIFANSTKTFIPTNQLAEGLYFLIGRDQSGKLLLESKVQVLR